jgi:DMSO/TMAO reductase YedYZ molybdopterin-dependent catalytic subunit
LIVDIESGQRQGSGLGPDRPQRPPAERGKPIGRRVVLGILGLGAVGVATGSRVQRGIDAALKPLSDTAVGSLGTGGGGWELYTITGGYPSPPRDYKLQVGGLVKQRLALSVDDLEALPPTRMTKTFQCVTGWSVDDVHWIGVSLTALLARAGMSQRAKQIRFTSFDGLDTESLTVEQAHQSGAIVAYSMLGAPVTKEHGGPVRLYVPGMFGYKSLKWLSGIYAVEKAPIGYWEQNGYPVNAWITGKPPSDG